MDVEACTACPYAAVRRLPVCGAGEPRSPIIIVGDAVREIDDVEAKPFAGRAGERLNRMLEAATINPAKVFTTLSVKCFPGREPRFKPEKAASVCGRFLKRQYDIIAPKAVILCGWKALNWNLLRWSSEKQVDDKTFASWVGPAIVFREVWGGVRFFAIHSPAQLAQRRDPDAEAKSVRVLTFVKEYVATQQSGQTCVPDTIELSRKRQQVAKQQSFDWRVTAPREECAEGNADDQPPPAESVPPSPAPPQP